MKGQLDEFAPLWGSEAKNYVLVSLELGSTNPCSCLIFHRESKTAMVIEEDEIAQAVIQRMVEAGVEIVDTIPRD